MNFDDDKKIDILMSALAERYSSIHKIRDRVQNIGIWALGLFLGAAAWFIQSEVTLANTEKALAIIGTILALVGLQLFYLADLKKGFKKQQETAARIENALGLFTPGTYDDSGESIYPSNWHFSGKKNGGGKFFRNTVLLLYIGAVFLVISILI